VPQEESKGEFERKDGKTGWATASLSLPRQNPRKDGELPGPGGVLRERKKKEERRADLPANRAPLNNHEAML